MIKIDAQIKGESEKLASDGKTPLFFAAGNKLLGIIAVADTMKEDSAEAIRQLRNMGIHVVMLTGDNKKTAKRIKMTFIQKSTRWARFVLSCINPPAKI